MAKIPRRYRTLRSGAVKPYEGRPTVGDVVAASPFESIRSAEIGPLFERYFHVLHRKNLGGTIQHLLYNGIVHNFTPGDPEAEAILRNVWQTEDDLIDSGGSRATSSFSSGFGREALPKPRHRGLRPSAFTPTFDFAAVTPSRGVCFFQATPNFLSK